MSGHDWDALAQHWHLFEHGGSDDAIIAAAIDDGACAPLLYVGCGLGTYAAHAAVRVGQVVAVDRSRAMARRARQLHPELPIVVADVAALPFADGAFRGVICATGVLEHLGERLAASLAELARVARGAPIHVAAFVARRGPRYDRHAAIEAWLVRDAADEVFDRVAADLGDRERAAQLLIDAFPRYGPEIHERELIDGAATAGLSTRRLVEDLARGVMLWRCAW